MALLNRGDTGKFTIKNETAYGAFPATGTAVYGGKIREFQPKMDLEFEKDPTDGSRIHSRVIAKDTEYGFSAKFTAFNDKSWHHWLAKAIGGNTGFTADAPSFTARVNVGPADAFSLTGCKVDRLTITSDSPGSITVFDLESKARWLCNPSNNNKFINADNTEYTFPAATVVNAAPLTSCNLVERKVEDEWVRIPAKTWKVTLGQNLVGEPSGLVNDNKCVTLSAGTALVPGEPEASLTFTVAASGTSWDALKIAVETEGEYRVTLSDGTVIHFTGCWLGGDPAARINDRHDETITVNARDVTYS